MQRMELFEVEAASYHREERPEHLKHTHTNRIEKKNNNGDRNDGKAWRAGVNDRRRWRKAHSW